MKLTAEDLRYCWNRWVNDKDLQRTQSFGRYIHDRFCKEPWPKLEFATTEQAWKLAWSCIRDTETRVTAQVTALETGMFDDYFSPNWQYNPLAW